MIAPPPVSSWKSWRVVILAIDLCVIGRCFWQQLLKFSIESLAASAKASSIEYELELEFEGVVGKRLIVGSFTGRFFRSLIHSNLTSLLLITSKRQQHEVNWSELKLMKTSRFRLIDYSREIGGCIGRWMDESGAGSVGCLPRRTL